MALSQAEPMKTLNLNALIGENFQSIQNLLAEIQKGTSNFSHFTDAFYHLMQSKIDPPLESIWVYAALSFRSGKSEMEEPLTRVAAAKQLFQLISACTGPCSSSRSVALLAPLVFEVYKLVVELLGKDLGSKKERKAKKELISLLDVMLGYISLCSSKNLSQESKELDLSLSMPVENLVRVWIDSDGGLELLFPLASGEIHRKISAEGCDVNYLAGVVVLEAFFLKLFLELRGGVAGADKEKELRNWVVGSLTGFGNFYFYEILVEVLLEPTLPGTTLLLNSENGVFLRKILYDAVILVDYTFLNPGNFAILPAERMRSLAITRLIVTHEAIEFCRENKDQKRATSYSNAFSLSRLRSQIMKWIHVGMEGGAIATNGCSPKDLIKSVLNLEKQGVRVFEDSLLKRRAKLAIDNPKEEYEHVSSNAEKKLDGDLLFYIDGKEEEEEEDGGAEEKIKDEPLSAAFVTAAHSMATENGAQKRKERGNAGKKRNVKYFRHDLSLASDSAKQSMTSAARDDGRSSDSELEDPQSD